MCLRATVFLESRSSEVDDVRKTSAQVAILTTVPSVQSVACSVFTPLFGISSAHFEPQQR